eukprot:11808489-Alexandrium_andersonii.AAC.1
MPKNFGDPWNAEESGRSPRSTRELSWNCSGSSGDPGRALLGRLGEIFCGAGALGNPPKVSGSREQSRTASKTSAALSVSQARENGTCLLYTSPSPRD